MSEQTIIITGGAGFIGANIVHHLFQHTPYQIVIVDKLSYAAHINSIDELLQSTRVSLEVADIANSLAMSAIFDRYSPDYLINLAAETHVDRSIDDPTVFIQSNIMGVYSLLNVVQAFYRTHRHFRMVQVSTDEVYGSLDDGGLFTEASAYAPNSPYAATKASADHLVRAWCQTYHTPVMVTHCTNNFGPYQHPEKLIPKVILNACQAIDIPVYGDGLFVRDWLYVADHCHALVKVLHEGRIGQRYNIGANCEYTNIDLAHCVCQVVEQCYPAAKNQHMKDKGLDRYVDLITHVHDRPGHDRRYAIDAGKIRDELDWQPVHRIDWGITQTVRWYLDNEPWCQAAISQTQQQNTMHLNKAL